MDLQTRYNDLLAQIAQTCNDFGRDPTAVTLMAVSKGQPVAKIQSLLSMGHRYFGESYAGELLEKAQQLQESSLRWSFIGTLQTNKIAKIMSVASEIQTLASEKHVRYAARYAREFNKVPYPVYIEANAGETQKAGIPLAEVAAFAAYIESESAGALDLRGLLCVPPAAYCDPDQRVGPVLLPALYAELGAIAAQTGAGLLSLGMSHDLKLAIEAGSHIVRIGTALFGARASDLKVLK